MSYVSVDAKLIGDERWIEAGADAFAVHVAALVYCNEHLSDGHITHAVARRVTFAVPDRRAIRAVSALIRYGFWTVTADGYLIEDFHAHAIPADQQRATRARWKADKDRRRQHNSGEHSLCKDPRYCRFIRERSTVESDVDSTGSGSHLYPTQLNPTQPNPTGGRVGEGEGGGDGSVSDGGSAALATASTPPPRQAAGQPTYGGQRATRTSTPGPPAYATGGQLPPGVRPRLTVAPLPPGLGKP